MMYKNSKIIIVQKTDSTERGSNLILLLVVGEGNLK